MNAPPAFLGVFLLSSIAWRKNAPPPFFPVFVQPRHGDISAFTLRRGLSGTVRIGQPGGEREGIEEPKTGQREAPHRAV
jgi:hypothetical protein